MTGVVLQGLAPIVSADTAVLILGSFPGARSLALGQYYGHPQNHFWKILQAVWPDHPLPTVVEGGYAARCDWLLARGLGLWDVYAACEREGSLDADIRAAVVNDFGGLKLPRLLAIAHNGGESFRHRQRVLASLAGQPSATGTANATIGVHQLPSTSPANASWRFERKLAAWRDIITRYGLA